MLVVDSITAPLNVTQTDSKKPLTKEIVVMIHLKLKPNLINDDQNYKNIFVMRKLQRGIILINTAIDL